MSYKLRLLNRQLINQPRRRLRRAWRSLRIGRKPVDVRGLEKRIARVEANQANLAFALYGDLASELPQRTALARSELKLDSQNGEAGILLYLFSKIGVTDRRFIEFGIGHIDCCNSTNLAVRFGWSGLLIDGSPDVVERARRFYAEDAPEAGRRVTILERLITPENIDDLFREHGFEGELDLMSVDIDGNDYWVWKAIDAVRPRVVVAEYNAAFGPSEIKISRYDEQFDRYDHHPFGWYFGASLAALIRLGERKGYVAIGCDTSGMNVFFVRDDVAKGHFEPVTAEEAYYRDARRMRRFTLEEQLESFRDLPFERDD